MLPGNVGAGTGTTFLETGCVGSSGNIIILNFINYKFIINNIYEI